MAPGMKYAAGDLTKAFLFPYQFERPTEGPCFYLTGPAAYLPGTDSGLRHSAIGSLYAHGLP